MREEGVTVIELAVALAVAGCLAAATVFAYQDWMGRYRVEKATCELYADLMAARLRAMQTSRNHFVVLGDLSYSILEDTNDNGENDNGDRLLPMFPKEVAYALSRNGSANVTLDRQGLISQQQTLRFVSSTDPDYDCMKVSRSRIIMGRYQGSSCVAR
ncbi:MAG: GspH/FimT family pseudopilin [Nitrospiraceae bacterium]|nr:GspH/FimT family pseudopilin [Nitrospiraceae bacterium]